MDGRFISWKLVKRLREILGSVYLRYLPHRWVEARVCVCVCLSVCLSVCLWIINANNPSSWRWLAPDHACGKWRRWQLKTAG